ncbi:hypothetical protein HPB51_024414 [Rhipicephalus microplus]|uniref:Uncharacterized protein n=1 Tax=Rhipicephalus microplus TaxID=6941 RepID=A0A9J6ED03_RHIMP|nr:hypothetical protein HPB51_024414 [Rhipicephalus microplus]
MSYETRLIDMWGSTYLNHHTIMRDAVVKDSGNFDHLGFFNTHSNLSTEAYNIPAYIGNAAAAAGIQYRDVQAHDLSSGNEGNIARSSSTEPSTVLYMDAGSSADEVAGHSDLEEDPQTPFMETPLNDNAIRLPSSLPSKSLSKALPIPSSGPKRPHDHVAYATAHTRRDYVRSGGTRQSASVTTRQYPAMHRNSREGLVSLRPNSPPPCLPESGNNTDRTIVSLAVTFNT